MVMVCSSVFRFENRFGIRNKELKLIFLDCVSFKPNSTFVLVQNLFCNGSHGISVGSLGQYVGEFDIVSDVYVYNVSLLDTSVSFLYFLSLLTPIIYLTFLGRCPNQSMARFPRRTQRRPPRRRWWRPSQQHNLRHPHRQQHRLRHRSRPMLRPKQPNRMPRIPIHRHHFRRALQELQRYHKHEVLASNRCFCLFRWCCLFGDHDSEYLGSESEGYESVVLLEYW